MAPRSDLYASVERFTQPCRHRAVAELLETGPAPLFLIGNRFSGHGSSKRERFSVYVTDVGILAAILIAHLTIGS